MEIFRRFFVDTSTLCENTLGRKPWQWERTIALFQTAVVRKKLLGLCVYDSVRLNGVDLERLVEMIPTIRIIFTLSINLDFTDQAVLSAFRLNTSIEYLDSEAYTIVDGHALGILKRPIDGWKRQDGFFFFIIIPVSRRHWTAFGPRR
jgi:hypothetical protein